MSTLTSVSGFPRIGQNRELQKIDRRLLEGCQRPRRRQGHRRRTARQALEAAAGRRHRPHSQQRLQLLRSDAGHRHPSQRDSAALRTSLLRQPGGHALRHGPRLPGRQGRRDRPADEEVVHHQLPLSGAQVQSAAESSSTPPSRSTSSTRPRRWASTPSPCSSARTRS